MRCRLAIFLEVRRKDLAEERGYEDRSGGDKVIICGGGGGRVGGLNGSRRT